jgi:hypothetical protein
MIYQNYLTTPEAVNRQLTKARPTAGAIAQAEYDEYFALVGDYCLQFSRYVEGIIGRSFVPYKATREYKFRNVLEARRLITNRGRYTLYLDEDLLVPSSVTWDGTLLSASYYDEYPYNELPYTALDFDWGNVPSISDTFGAGISVVGTWGYHTNLQQAYTLTGQTGTFANSTATSVTVSDDTPFETYMYIRLENELMLITSINRTTNVLTVQRGVNGTTAEAHTSAGIEIYNPVADVKLAVTRCVAWGYNNRNDLGNVINFADGTSVVQGIAPFIRNILSNLSSYSLTPI